MFFVSELRWDKKVLFPILKYLRIASTHFNYFQTSGECIFKSSSYQFADYRTEEENLTRVHWSWERDEASSARLQDIDILLCVFLKINHKSNLRQRNKCLELIDIEY